MGGGGGRRDEKKPAKINGGDYSRTAPLGVEIANVKKLFIGRKVVTCLLFVS